VARLAAEHQAALEEVKAEAESVRGDHVARLRGEHEAGAGRARAASTPAPWPRLRDEHEERWPRRAPSTPRPEAAAPCARCGRSRPADRRAARPRGPAGRRARRRGAPPRRRGQPSSTAGRDAVASELATAAPPAISSPASWRCGARELATARSR
jgi:hypothetical protein